MEEDEEEEEEIVNELQTGMEYDIHLLDQDEEEVVEEDDINEFVDQDMSEYFERSTCYVTCVMDIDANEDGDDEEEEQEACAIYMLA
ncbi:hypothetical protein KY289_027234 [Solanum tuberosum]|nr:hypothetical protein KY289_027234 [Solanum tuberosum]